MNLLQEILLVVKFFLVPCYNENQDTGFFSDEGNSYPQMASLSTALMDTPASGHEGVQHQNSASSIALEGGKTEHQIQSMMSLSEDSKR